MDPARVGVDDELEDQIWPDQMPSRQLYSRVFGGFIADDAEGDDVYSVQTRLTHTFHSLTMAGSRNVVLLLEVTYERWDDPYTSLNAQLLLTRLSFSANGGEPVRLCTFYQDESEGNEPGIDADGFEIDDYDFYSPSYWKRKINDDALDALKKHLAKDDPLLKPGALKDLVCQFCFGYAFDCREKGYLYNRNFDLMHPWVSL